MTIDRNSQSHTSRTEGECPSLLELAAWCDGRLDDTRSGALALHIIECSSCRGALSQGASEGEVDGVNVIGRIDAIIGIDSLDARHDDARIEALVARAVELVPAPAALPLRGAPRSRAWRSALAMAASLVAAFAGWQVASIFSSHEETHASATTLASSTVVPQAAAVASATDTGDASDDADDGSVFVTFGLLDDFAWGELIDTTQRSDS